MDEHKDSDDHPTSDEVRDRLIKLRLRGLSNQQNRQLPVIVTVADSPEYFGLCALAEHNILDRQYQHIPPSEKSKEYDGSITDLSAVVNDYRTLLRRGFSSSDAVSCSVSLWEANNTLTVEAKKDAWEFIRRCAGVELGDRNLVETGCAYRATSFNTRPSSPVRTEVRSGERGDSGNRQANFPEGGWESQNHPAKSH